MATTTGASTATSVLDGWKAQGIRFVRFELPDMHGTSRTKMVPIERAYGYAESGLNMYGGLPCWTADRTWSAGRCTTRRSPTATSC